MGDEGENQRAVIASTRPVLSYPRNGTSGRSQPCAETDPLLREEESV